MRPIDELTNSPRLKLIREALYHGTNGYSVGVQDIERDKGFAAWLIHPLIPADTSAVCSWDRGWEHVSVSNGKHPLSWKQMCVVKNIFWREEEIVVQYHPARSEYVNIDESCLHLWRPISSELPKPTVDQVI